MKESVQFEKIIFDAIEDFPPRAYKRAAKAIAAFAFEGAEPKRLPLLEATAFTLARPLFAAEEEESDGTAAEAAAT